MAHLIVGDDDCEFNTVLREMRKSKIFNEIVAKREDLAVELNIDQQVQSIINKNYKLLDEGALPIMQKYLIYWRGRFADQATLGKLLNALDACELTDISEKIRKADFYVKASKKKSKKEEDGIHGDDLPDNTRKTGEIVEEKERDETDGVGSWLSKTILKTGKIEKREWKSRTFATADNLFASLRKRKQGEPMLGKGQYALPGKENGYAIILNIIHYPKYQETYRVGAQYDSFKLTHLLTELGYEVMKFDDPNYLYTKSDVETIIRQFRELIRKIQKKPASVIVFVGGHGKYGEIEMSEGKSANLFDSIVYQFDSGICEDLKNVPKIFIVNSCRVPNRVDSNTNKIEDAVVCYATLPHNYAYRSPEVGSHFVNSFVKIVAENAHKEHFTHMMRMVSADVKQKVVWPPGENPSNELQQPMHEKLPNFGKLYFNVFESHH